MEAELSQLMAANSPEGFTFRRLKADDYHSGYIDLLGNLTQTGDVPESLFLSTLQKVASQPETYYILVFEDQSSHSLAASGTLFIEQKFVHSASKVGHIEDIVVSPAYQRRGLGKRLIDGLTCIARAAGCYKAILDCAEDVAPFYEKCGLTTKGLLMAHYF